MAPQLLFDICGLDFDKVQYGVEQIEQRNPHRGAMRMLDGVVYVQENFHTCVAYKDIRTDAFWVPGHIPGRPLFPGVLMIEAAAQLASFVTMLRYPDIKFMGFAKVDAVKFRGQVEPGDRLVILGKMVEFRHRRSICDGQALVNGTVVFEGRITGMPM